MVSTVYLRWQQKILFLLGWNPWKYSQCHWGHKPVSHQFLWRKVWLRNLWLGSWRLVPRRRIHKSCKSFRSCFGQSWPIRAPVSRVSLLLFCYFQFLRHEPSAPLQHCLQVSAKMINFKWAIDAWFPPLWGSSFNLSPQHWSLLVLLTCNLVFCLRQLECMFYEGQEAMRTK